MRHQHPPDAPLFSPAPAPTGPVADSRTLPAVHREVLAALSGSVKADYESAFNDGTSAAKMAPPHRTESRSRIGTSASASRSGGGVIESIPASKLTDPPVCGAAEVAMNATGRRQRTLDLILARLRAGPATAAELCTVSHRFGGRIFDLRKLGHQITTAHNGASGATTYTLKGEAI